MTIDMLPDNVLLEVFDLCKDSSYPIDFAWVSRWKRLTQVCRRWRLISLGSPRRLDLRIVCTDKTPTKTSLDIWPSFLIAIIRSPSHSAVDEKGVENVIAALEHRDRISEILLYDISASPLETLVAVMHEPLPALRYAYFSSSGESVPAFPKTFLGGSAPCLRSFSLEGIPFPSFPKFVSFATHIVNLSLLRIPNSGYIPPDVMVKCLEALPNLKHLSIGFRCPPSRPVQTTPPPLTRAVLPALTFLSFTGASEYLEDFVAQIDTPILNQLSVVFFLDLIFDIPRLRDFIDRIKCLGSFNQANVEFHRHKIKLALGPPIRFELEIVCERADWQLSSMAQIFTQQLPLISRVENLEIHAGLSSSRSRWQDDPDMDPSQWLELFHPFVAVQTLYVSSLLVRPVATALQELTGGRVLEMLPALRDLCLDHLEPSEPAQEGIRSFIAARQLSNHPIAVQPLTAWLAKKWHHLR